MLIFDQNFEQKLDVRIFEKKKTRNCDFYQNIILKTGFK